MLLLSLVTLVLLLPLLDRPGLLPTVLDGLADLLEVLLPPVLSPVFLVGCSHMLAFVVLQRLSRSFADFLLVLFLADPLLHEALLPLDRLLALAGLPLLAVDSLPLHLIGQLPLCVPDCLHVLRRGKCGACRLRDGRRYARVEARCRVVDRASVCLRLRGVLHLGLELLPGLLLLLVPLDLVVSVVLLLLGHRPLELDALDLLAFESTPCFFLLQFICRLFTARCPHLLVLFELALPLLRCEAGVDDGLLSTALGPARLFDLQLTLPLQLGNQALFLLVFRQFCRLLLTLPLQLLLLLVACDTRLSSCGLLVPHLLDPQEALLLLHLGLDA